MAKFGEGDSRWIVQDLGEQGTNVNNWHWKEFDALEWSRERLQAMFTNLSVLDGSAGLSLSISGAEVDGEAIINNRKSKLIPAYELKVTLPWTGDVRDGDGNVAGTSKGKITLPYVADENHDEEPEIKFSSETEDPTSQRLKQAFLSKGKKAVLEQLNKFVADLRAGGPVAPGSKGAAEAAAAGQQASTTNGAAAGKVKLSSAKPDEVSAAATSTSKSSSKATGRSLSLQQSFYARPSDLYECFVVEGKIKAYTQSNAVVEPRVGGKFSWFNGSVSGEFLELEQDKKIVMLWRFNTWVDGCNSKVTITLDAPEVGHTILKLSQTGIPEEDKFHQPVYDQTESGWKGQILTRIRQVFGYGV